jgi:hypothetical protein
LLENLTAITTKATEIRNFLSRNPLDKLVEELGGPENVADFTGRRKTQTNQINAYLSGKIKIAIISDGANSYGISLQANKDIANNSKRLHVTIELPLSADKAIEQLGRTHRANQLCPPDYIFLVSKLGGEKHFASRVCQVIESMNAREFNNTVGSGEFSELNVESKEKKSKNRNITCI